jgi:hypothetical protein
MHFAFHELAVAPLRCFQPSALDIRIRGGIEICYQGANKLDLIVGTEFAYFSLSL